MISENRKQQILDLIRKNGSVRVANLSQLFEVSEVTVRNYLAEMEKQGLLSRTHGGAISSYKPYYSMNFNQRFETNHTEKDMIAKRVAQMVEPNDTVMLNAGTTTLLTFRQFPADYNLNIVTNSISIALEATENPNYNVLLVGGAVNSKYQFTYGSDAVSVLKNYHADKLILSVDGIDINNGFTTYYNKEATIDRVMLENCDTCIIAADNSKFNRTAFTKISQLEVADYIVTDSVFDKEFITQFRNLGVEIITP